MPSSVLKMSTPFEKLYLMKPSYNSLRIFRCRCFPYLRNYTKNKFSKRTYPCVFIGYSYIHKGYRCLDPKTNRVYISRHVVFDEEVFPFHEQARHITHDTSRKLDVTMFADEEVINNFGSRNKSFPTRTLEEIYKTTTRWDDCAEALINSKLVTEPTATNLNHTTIEPTTMDGDIIELEPTVMDGYIAESSIVGANNVQATKEGVVPTPTGTNIVHTVDGTSKQNEMPTQQPELHDIVGELYIELPIDSTSNLMSEMQEVEEPTTRSVQSQNATVNFHPVVTRSKIAKEIQGNKCLNTFLISSHMEEHRSYKTTLKIPHWKATMDEEMKALHDNQTWEVTHKPPNTNIIGCKWIFKTKLKEDGSVERFKARLVAQGYSQTE